MMNYIVQYDGYFYPVIRSWYKKPLILPVYPYEDNVISNFNTRKKEIEVPSFKPIQICPKFKTEFRLRKVVDLFLITQKAYCQDTFVIPLLYCEPVQDNGDYFESNYPLNNPNRVLWNEHGIWKIVFVIKHLPKYIYYDNGLYFINRFSSKQEAELHFNKFINNE